MTKENKNAEFLFQCLNDLEESNYKNSRGEIIDPSSKAKTKSYFWHKIVAIAASLALVIGSFTLLKDRLPAGNSNHNIGSTGNLSDDKSSMFMKYEGPVLPIMTPIAQKTDIEAERKVIYDFYRMTDMLPTAKTVFLRDQYKIRRKGQEKQIKLLYPFISSVEDMYYSYPRLVQDGKVLDAKLYYGGYAGDFVSTSNEIEPSQTLNLRDYTSWKEYERVLNGERYMKEAFSSPRDVENIPVTVYSFTNSYYSEKSEAENPTLVAEIQIDRKNSAVFTLGFDGFAKLDDSKKEFYQYSIPKRSEPSTREDKRYLIVVGEDTPSIKIETQTIGGWEAYEKKSSRGRNNLEEAGANLERKEMTLNEALELTLPSLYEGYKENQLAREDDFSYWKLGEHKISPYILSYEEFKGLYIKELFGTGVLSENPMMRYEDGSLESLDVTNIQRVIFAEIEIDFDEINITELEISSYKQGSHDFYGHKYEQEIYGYDLLRTLNSAIPVNKFEVEINDYNKLDTVKENFGFDFDKGIKKAILSNDEAGYFMDVTEKK